MLTDPFEDFLNQVPLHNEDRDKPKTVASGSQFASDEDLQSVQERLANNPDIYRHSF